MKQASEKQQTQCLKPEQHELKNQYFCLSCAARNISGNEVTFCALCYPKKYRNHKDHKQFINMDSKSFREKIVSFQRYLLQNVDNFGDFKNSCMREIMENDEIRVMNPAMKKFLILSKFWKFDDHRTFKQANQSYLKLIKKYVDSSEPSKDLIVKTEIIEWANLDGQGGSSIFNQMLKQASQEKQNLLIQIKKTELMIEVFSTVEENTQNQIIKKVDQAIEEFPDDWALLAAKLYLMELHEGNKRQWQPLLKKMQELQPKLKDSFLALYLQSHQFWVKLNKSEIENQGSSVKFVDIVSGNVFKLIKPEEYVDTINRAIIGQDKPSFVLLAAKGLGLLAQGKYSEAVKNFKNAFNAYPHQSLSMNQQYTLAKQSKNYSIPPSQIMNQLQNKSKHYIINTIKYLKKEGLPKEILECCDTLRAQGNDSTFMRIEEVKAHLKLNQVKEAVRVRSEIPADKINDVLRERLDRKELYASARLEASEQNLKDATLALEKLVGQKQSPSAYYSLASIHYNQQKWQQAEQCINKALALKSNNKYKKLKMYIHIMKKQLDEAKVILAELPKDSIDVKIQEMLNQFATK